MAALRRAFAPLTLVVFLCSLVLPLIPGAHVIWDDDGDGGPGVGPRTMQVAASVPLPAADEHCALCHLERALAGATVGRIVSPLPGFITSELQVAATVACETRTAPLDQPSRAPPASIAL